MNNVSSSSCLSSCAAISLCTSLQALSLCTTRSQEKNEKRATLQHKVSSVAAAVYCAPQPPTPLSPIVRMYMPADPVSVIEEYVYSPRFRCLINYLPDKPSSIVDSYISILTEEQANADISNLFTIIPDRVCQRDIEHVIEEYGWYARNVSINARTLARYLSLLGYHSRPIIQGYLRSCPRVTELTYFHNMFHDCTEYLIKCVFIHWPLQKLTLRCKCSYLLNDHLSHFMIYSRTLEYLDISYSKLAHLEIRYRQPAHHTNNDVPNDAPILMQRINAAPALLLADFRNLIIGCPRLHTIRAVGVSSRLSEAQWQSLACVRRMGPPVTIIRQDPVSL